MDMPDKPVLLPLPEEMHTYQVNALAFSVVNPRSYQALDMGMGKTLISLMWARHVLLDTNAILVFAPLRTVYSSWPEEIETWAPELTYTILHGPNKDANLRKKVDLYLINYEGQQWLFDTLKRMFAEGKKIPFRALIVDEGSMCKSASTKRFKMFKVMADLFTRWRLVLSGTPRPNGSLDLWPQYYILDGGERLGKSVTQFKQEHYTQLDRFLWVAKPGSDEVVREKIKDITYRLEARDYLVLPERTDNIIKVKLPTKVMKEYEQLEKDFFIQLDSADVEAHNAPSLAMKLRQFVQGAVYTDIHIQGNKYQRPDGTITNKDRTFEVVHNEKLKVLKSLVEEAGGNGILCAIQFKFELKIIQKLFPKAPVIAGGCSPKDAAKYIKAWNRGEIPLMLCHPASISHGVNLQSGGHIIVHYGLTWSLEQYMQLNARVDRQGQKHGTIIHHLICEDTVDEGILRALQGKFKGQKALLDYLRDYCKGA